MPTDTLNPELPFELNPEQQAVLQPRREQDKPTALVHILTPEFQGLNPDDYAEIPDSSLQAGAAQNIKKYLFDTSLDGKNVVRYQSVEHQDKWLSIAVNPEHFNLFSRHVPMLARTAINKVLEAKDRALRQETGNPGARARSNQDIKESERAAVRTLKGKEEGMEQYLATELEPRLELVGKFLEMTQGKNANLARGSRRAVRERFEHLRTFVFGDMLDAIGGQREWSEDTAKKAEQIIQKRLYIAGASRDRVANLEEMLRLAEEYYGNVRALVLGRLAEVHKYYRKHPEAVADVEAVDKQRREEKEQLQLRTDQE